MIPYWFARLFRWLRRRIDPKLQVIAIDLHAPCPACGHRDHEIRWTGEKLVIIRRCKTCSAVVQLKPLVDPTLWAHETRKQVA